MLLSKKLLRKKKKKQTLSRPQVPCSVSWQHVLSSERILGLNQRAASNMALNDIPRSYAPKHHLLPF